MATSLTTKPEPSEETYDYSASVQRKIVAMLLADAGQLARFAEVVRPEYFEIRALAGITELIIKFFEKYHRAPDADELDEEISTLLASNNRLDPGEYQEAFVGVLQAITEGDFDYVRDKALDFARYQAMRRAILKSAETLAKKKDYSAIVQEITQAASLCEEKDSLRIVNLADVEPQQVEWLWEEKFPKSKLSLIVGDPNVGKSYFTMMMASVITTGSCWPDIAHEAEKGRVILLSAEDGLADIVVPRLMAHSGDRALVEVIEGTAEQQMFNLLKDLQKLDQLIQERHDVRLVIIDPISAYLGSAVNAHKDQDVRGLLTPIAKLAEERRVAILGIMHLNKSTDLGAMYRVSGSMAFVAAARAVWLIYLDENFKDNRLRHFNVVKCNVTGDAVGFSFKIEEKRVVIQPDAVLPDITEAIGTIEEKQQTKLEWAEKVLKVVFKEQTEWAAQDIETLADENGIKEWCLREAAKRCGIKHRKTRWGDWLWVKES
jgi:putative DNA primase/helicase